MRNDSNFFRTEEDIETYIAILKNSPNRRCIVIRNNDIPTLRLILKKSVRYEKISGYYYIPRIWSVQHRLGNYGEISLGTAKKLAIEEGEKIKAEPKPKKQISITDSMADCFENAIEIERKKLEKYIKDQLEAHIAQVKQEFRNSLEELLK